MTAIPPIHHYRRSIEMTLKTAIATVGVGALVLAAPAGAHVTVTPTEAPADGYALLEFAVPHGCDGSSTDQLRIQIPESVPQATPQVHPGWKLTTKEGPKDEVELHGETITEGVSEVMWTAQEAPLPDGYLDTFGVQVKLPAAVGDELAFPAIQRCEKGTTRWIELAQEGESADELEAPAPLVTLTAAGDTHGATQEDDDEGAGEAGAPEGDDDSDSNGLAIAGLVVGALGLVTGGTALARSRRSDGH
jgi:uncharacterized protein YcnI